MVTANRKSMIDRYTHKKRKRDPNTTLKIVTKSQENKRRRGGKKTYKNKSNTINKMAIRTYISIITLNVNRLNAPTKGHRLAEWIQKQDLYISCLRETHFRPRGTYRLKVRRWKKVFYAYGNQKKAGVAILRQNRL